MLFSDSSIRQFEIPPNLIEFQEGWCQETPYLTEIKIDKKNSHFILYEDLILLRKSSIEIDGFDVLVFCVRNILHAIIQSYIKRIGPYAFDECRYLKFVDIQTIEKFAFHNSSIERFIISPHIEKIGAAAFKSCNHLKTIDIQMKSELKTIEKEAFKNTEIECFVFPPHLTYIGEYAFEKCRKLQIVEFEENSEIEIIDLCIFESCASIVIMIPKNVIDHLKLIKIDE